MSNRSRAGRAAFCLLLAAGAVFGSENAAAPTMAGSQVLTAVPGHGY